MGISNTKLWVWNGYSKELTLKKPLVRFFQVAIGLSIVIGLIEQFACR